MVLVADVDQQRSGKRSESISQLNQGGKRCADGLPFAPDKIRAFPVSEHKLGLPGAGTGKVGTETQKGFRAAEGASGRKTFFNFVAEQTHTCI